MWSIVVMVTAFLLVGALHLAGVNGVGAKTPTPTPPPSTKKITINKKWVVIGVGVVALLLVLWFRWDMLQSTSTQVADVTTTVQSGGNEEVTKQADVTTIALWGGVGILVLAGLGSLYWKKGWKGLIPVGLTALGLLGLGLIFWWGYHHIPVPSGSVGVTSQTNVVEHLRAAGKALAPGVWESIALLEQYVVVLGIYVPTYWLLTAMVGTLIIGWGKGAFHDWFLALLYSVILLVVSQVLAYLFTGSIDDERRWVETTSVLGFFLACTLVVRNFSLLGLVLVVFPSLILMGTLAIIHL